MTTYRKSTPKCFPLFPGVCFSRVFHFIRTLVIRRSVQCGRVFQLRSICPASPSRLTMFFCPTTPRLFRNLLAPLVTGSWSFSVTGGPVSFSRTFRTHSAILNAFPTNIVVVKIIITSTKVYHF